MIKLTIETVDQWVDDVLHRRAGRLDLSRVEIIDPYALLVIAITVREFQKQGRILPLDWPQHDGVRAWLNAMGLPQWLGRNPVQPPSAPPRSSVAQPMTRIDAEDGIRQIVEAFDQQLALRYPLTDESRCGLVRIMFELFQNIPQHANATGNAPGVLGVAAMQEMSREQQLMLAVADDGIGLRESLSMRASFTDITHAQALNEVLFKGVSRHADPGRGGELRRIARLVRTWEGTLVIRSGDAVLYMDNERGAVYDAPLLPGVQIAVSLPRYVLGIESDPALA
ncbi:hypothetical protein JW848_09510 [Candidatus Bipolaricaulota bacterium]|nr:hypothetical protein [Candidatus Bipolaricaulota bacterium]